MDSTLTTLDHEPNRIACDRCGDPLGTTEGQDRTIRVGDYDTDSQTWNRFTERQVCWPCWSEREGQKHGTEWHPDTVQGLYDVLATADGDLVAILYWWTGRPAVRVVDGEPEAARFKIVRDGVNDDGQVVIRSEAVWIDDFGREDFMEVADPPDGMGLVRLLEVEETAFAELDGDVDADD